MQLRTTIRGQILVLMLIPVFLLAIGSGIAMHLLRQTADDTARSQHETEVFTTAQMLLEKMLDAETGVRGYMVTGQPLFLEPYTAALPAVPQSISRLAMLLADKGSGQRLLLPIEMHSARELQILASYISVFRAGRPDLARAAVAQRAGKKAMDELRHDVAQLERKLQGDSAATLKQTQRSVSWLRTTIMVCIGLGLCFAVIASLQMRRAIVKRVDFLVRKAHRLAEGNDIGQPLGGSDEIAGIDRAFHHMALLLAQRNRELDRYQLLAERTQDLMIFAHQRDGRIMHANAAALAAYRYSLAEITRLTVDGLQADLAPATLAEPRTGNSYVSHAYEAEQRRSDGSTFPGEVTVEGRFIAGEPMQLSIIRDISDRKHAEGLIAEALGAARDAARAKADFLATMSHEIRTPMNAVIGMTELVLQTGLTDEQREALLIVNDSGTSLLRIIDDVLDFSKIEAGKLNVEISEFAFANVIESVAVTLAAQAGAQGLALVVFADPAAPSTLYGDAGRIRQVLTNLVGNAIKFTHAGGVRLCADVAATTPEWCDIRFSVTDTGIGIAPEHLTRIFQPFAQADASTTRLYGGSGLGLSICHQLVELMGGELRAQSVAGSGSTFSFVLRLRAGETNERAERSDLRALVVEPVNELPSEFTRYLRAWKVHVTVVDSFRAAFEAFAQADNEGRMYDIVIMDAEAPENNAFALGSALAAHARYAAARRIIVTSSKSIERRREAIATGISAYLVRPLRQSQLFDCVMNLEPLPPARPLEPPAAQTGLRILLAEDNLINQRVALQQLFKLGYEATVVGTGRAALAAAISERYDLIFMDCFMPEMDGYAATSAIRRHEARTGDHTPIIALTANAQAGDRDACIAAGMDDYLAKPVTLGALRDMLDRYGQTETSATLVL